MVGSNRANDTKTEREVAAFLDEHLYSRDLFQDATRTDDRDSQVSGSDIVITVPSLGISGGVVDEKAASSFWDRPGSIPTFALELSFINRAGGLNEGWFTDDSKRTEYYLFAWLNAKQRYFTKDEITWLEYALVRRKDIEDWLAGQGLDRQGLRKRCAEIREVDFCRKEFGKDYWFCYSKQLAEKPINIVIKKKVYLDLALLHGEFGKVS